MPKKMAVLDYGKCHPEECEDGICLAGLACPYKVLRQATPYEMPDPNPALCIGCGTCAQACPCKAIRMM